MNQQLWFEVQAMHKAWTDLHMDRFLSKHQQVKEEAMKVQRKHGAVETYEVLEESTNYYIIKGSATFVHVVSKADYEPVQEWSHLYTFYANPKGPIFELRSKEGPEGSIIIEGKVK